MGCLMVFGFLGSTYFYLFPAAAAVSVATF